MNEKQRAKLVALIIVAVLFFGVLYFTRPEPVPDIGDVEIDIGHVEPEPEPEYDFFAHMLFIITEQVNLQAGIDEMLLAELDSGVHTFEDPFVLVNPYGMSPLTAIVLFTSDEPLRTSVHVPGITEYADVEFTFDDYNTRHIMPVFGLYPDDENMVELTGITARGVKKSNTLSVNTAPLPEWLGSINIMTELAQPGHYQPGLNFTFAQKSAFDINGDYRWFYNDPELLQPTLYKHNGNIILTKGHYHAGDVFILEVNMLGRLISV
jgi:arylsulfate sulfotransferase